MQKTESMTWGRLFKHLIRRIAKYSACIRPINQN